LPTIYDLKPKFQALLRPLCAALAKAGITANQVTLAACALSFAHGALNLATGGAVWVLLLLPAVLFIRMGMNAIDGMLAREFAQQSKLGAILNEGGLAREAIGRIQVRDSFSLVELPEDGLERLLGKLKDTRVGGKQLKLRRYRED